MLGVAANHVLESGQFVVVCRCDSAGGNLWRSDLIVPQRLSSSCRGRLRQGRTLRYSVAALDPAVPGQPELPDFQWPSIQVGRRSQQGGGGGGDVEREVKAAAKEKWSKHNETALSADTALPLPMAFPGTEPRTEEEMEALMQCNPELENCKTVVYQWTSKCQRCQGTGEVSFYRKRGKEVISKCIACIGIGYVQRMTSREDKVDDSDPP